MHQNDHTLLNSMISLQQQEHHVNKYCIVDKKLLSRVKDKISFLFLYVFVYLFLYIFLPDKNVASLT